MADILAKLNFSMYLTEMDHLGPKLPLTKGIYVLYHIAWTQYNPEYHT